MDSLARATCPFGSWKSPITAALVARGSVGLDQICTDGGDVYWIEKRPAEGGRQVIVQLGGDGQLRDITPAPFNARTRLHEYGGQCYTVSGGVLVFSNLADGRLYRQEGEAAPRPITPEGPFRYGDLSIAPGGDWMICVREEFPGSVAAGDARQAAEPVDAIVGIEVSGGVWALSAANEAPGARVLVQGNDFYNAPRLSPDGRGLAWLAWDHPNMPWDGTELWLGEIAPDSAVVNRRLVAGGAAESVFQPEWSPDGMLYFVSDRSGWWNLYRLRGDEIEALHPMDAEFGLPAWVPGLRTYDFAGPEQVACSFCRRGVWELAILDAGSGAFEPVDLPYTQITGMRGARNRVLEAGSRKLAFGEQEAGIEGSGKAGAPGVGVEGVAWFLASSPYEPASVVRLDLETRATRTVCRSSDSTPGARFISPPQTIEFPTERGRTAHGFFYAPRNGDLAGPPGERPPLIVICHGGPTDAVSPALSLGTQFWTSRGFAVTQVNYGGSTGYGREYRERLNGQWGVVDVEDCVNAARYLAAQGLVDIERMVIRGGSAGGFTALRALATTRLFRAGAIYYGVSDLEMLAQDTPKFESRYHLRLVGPYPEGRELYRQRSPVDQADRIAAALILFQGLEDGVVLPRQTEAMVRAARANGLPVAYLAFEGEGHGFRRAETIQRALEAELYFYSRVFGFALPEGIDPVPIEILQS